MKWLINGDRKDLPQWFEKEEQAIARLDELIHEAELDCDDSGYPNWIHDIQLCEVKLEIQNSPNGLIVIRI